MASISENDKYSDLEKLNSRNYHFWQHRMKRILMNKGLWTAVENEISQDEGARAYKAWKAKDENAYTVITMAVEDDALKHIMNAKTAKEAWRTLKELNKKSSNTRVCLKKKLFQLTLREGRDMNEHILEFTNIVTQLEVAGKKFDDNDLAMLLLRSVPESYDVLTTNLEDITEEDLTLDLVKDTLVDEYKKKIHGMQISKGDGLNIKIEVHDQTDDTQKECEKHQENQNQSQGGINSCQIQKQVKYASEIINSDNNGFDFLSTGREGEVIKDVWIINPEASTHAGHVYTEGKKEKKLVIQGLPAPKTEGSTTNFKRIVKVKARDHLFGSEPPPLARIRQHRIPVDPLAALNISGQSWPKPAYSYSCLTSLALMNSETGSLPVSDIYKFVSEHFPYFKTAPNGWKNSIRHNLSLHKSFVKIQDKLKNPNPRRGGRWTIVPTKFPKMNAEVQKFTAKNSVSIKRAMIRPETLEKLKRGQMKYKNINNDDDDPLADEGDSSEGAEYEDEHAKNYFITADSIADSYENNSQDSANGHLDNESEFEEYKEDLHVQLGISGQDSDIDLRDIEQCSRPKRKKMLTDTC